jgi:pilus assembly protein CpaE
MRIVLAVEQHEHIEPLRRVLLGEGVTCDAEDAVVYHGAAARLAAIEADLVLVACGDKLDAAEVAIRESHAATAAPIFACGDTGNGESVRRAIRAGATEFLSIDQLREELTDALLKVEAERHLPNERGTVVAMYSPNGGCGVTTTAINLAARLARKDHGKVALFDIRRSPSDMSLMLDIEPEHTMDEVTASWQRLDGQMLDAAMTRHDSGFHVLPQSGYPVAGAEQGDHLSAPAVRQLITLARRRYQHVVLDLEHDLSPETFEAMQLASIIALVARPDVPGLRRARWALDTAEQNGLARDRFRMVLNRFGGAGQVKLAKAEEILGIKIFQSIPEDRRTVSRAINRGVPIANLARLSRVNRSFASLARSVRRHVPSRQGKIKS